MPEKILITLAKNHTSSLSYVPKRNKNVLLVTTAHDQAIVDASAKKKPEAVLFYNEQRCAIDVVNHMLRDITSKPKCDTWVLAAWSFLLDVSALNGYCILSYTAPGLYPSRRAYMKELVNQLITPWLKHRATLPHLKADTVHALKVTLATAAPDFKFLDEGPIPIAEKNEPAKCFICIHDINEKHQGETRKTKKKNKNKLSTFCASCHYAVCPKHRVKVPDLPEICVECYRKKI